MASVLAFTRLLNDVVADERGAYSRGRPYRRCFSGELSRVEQDGMAQVLSYFPSIFVPTLPGRFVASLHYHTLAAVSPRVRLCAEALSNHASADNAFEAVQVSEGHVTYWIQLCGSKPDLTRLALSLWWARRCGLPIVIAAPNACRLLLELLPASWRRGVAELHLTARATSIADAVDTRRIVTVDGEEPPAGRQQKDMVALHRSASSSATPAAATVQTTFFDALPTFTHLRRLVVDGAFAVHPAQVATALVRALHVANTFCIREVVMRRCEGLQTLSALHAAPQLEKLTACDCDVRDLDGLSRCPLLTFVNVSRNRQLRDLFGIVGAPRLQVLVADECAVSCTGDIGSGCPLLRTLHLSGNRQLSRLAGLAGALRLRELHLRETAVEDLSVVHCCPRLEVVDVNGCPHLRNVATVPPSVTLLGL